MKVMPKHEYINLLHIRDLPSELIGHFLDWLSYFPLTLSILQMRQQRYRGQLSIYFKQQFWSLHYLIYVASLKESLMLYVLNKCKLLSAFIPKNIQQLTPVAIY